ncbi:Annexin A4 [Mycena sanguinolenta]|uniref:Annexin A4 n=1 Tax=Mycena sanguinolenta TaxID=230812 RepID=A0A8H6YU19_9AGAR|nr:Annexin A4 [Mycena sanguinolenta]
MACSLPWTAVNCLFTSRRHNSLPPSGKSCPTSLDYPMSDIPPSLQVGPDGYTQGSGAFNPTLENPSADPPAYLPITPQAQNYASQALPYSFQGSQYYPPTAGSSTNIYPQGGYVPPTGSTYGATQGYVPPSSLSDLPPSYQAAAEPAVILYRDIMVYNPKSSERLQKYATLDADIEAILNCSKSSGSKADSRVNALVVTLAQLGALKLEVVAHEFPLHPRNHKHIPLQHFIEDEISGDVQAGLIGLILGPVKYDADRINYAIKALPVKEDILRDIFLDLTPQEARLLAYVYHQTYKTPLLAHRIEIHDEDWRLFKAIIHPNRRLLEDQVYDNLRLTLEDVQSIYKAQDYRPKPERTKEVAFTEVFAYRTRQHIGQVCSTYQEKHKKSMSQVIRSTFSGNYRSALLSIAASYEPDPKHPELDPRAIRDAKRIAYTMAGIGTNKEMLLMRVLRAHWSHRRMDEIIAAFPLCNDKRVQLVDRVKGEKGGIMSGQGFKDFKFLVLTLISGVPAS